MESHNLHRRRSSKDEEENMVLIARPMELDPPADEVPLVLPPPPPRNRVQSSPTHSHHHHHTRSVSSVGLGAPPSAGPHRTSFGSQRSPNGINGHSNSPLRSSFAPLSPGHARTRSISSTAFSPPVHSPLASSFSSSTSTSSPTLYPFPSSTSSLSPSQSAPDTSTLPPPSTKQSRRHSRLHSRNLSVFFPRPGSLPATTISEDGAQELEVRADEEAPVSIIPSAGPSISFPGSRRAAPPTPLGAGFTFGGRPPTSSATTSSEFATNRANTPTSGRRGHHHKHSMSHSFFSFLEPGENGIAQARQEDLHTQPTPIPVSPWAPISAFPQSAKGTGTSASSASVSAGFPPHTPVTANGNHSFGIEEEEFFKRPDSPEEEDIQPRPGALAVAIIQSMLGAWLWVRGQQIGSLSVTGLGYWVVFDAIGVGLGGVVPQWLELKSLKSETPSEREKRRIKRPYGNAPLQTVLMFAQAVYLMFSAVYVCKETVEHLLLSAGHGEGHHHHPGDEDENMVGIEFPVMLAFITLSSVILTSWLYDNHSRLVNVTNNRIPSLQSLLRRLSSSSRFQNDDPPPNSQVGIILSNPFVASSLSFASAIIFVALFIPSGQQQTFDLLLAAIITIVTFNLAYRACTILGTILLQTAPPRGTQGGRMEAFLRVMREVERHPQVLHLPAPHIWQLTPMSSSKSMGSVVNGSSSSSSSESLVVTLELHVKHDLGDDDVLELTRWAWEKCANALSGGRFRRDGLGPQVTVGIVRG